MEMTTLGRTGVQVSRLCFGGDDARPLGQHRRGGVHPHRAPRARRGHQLHRHRRRLRRRRLRVDPRQGAGGPARQRRPGDEAQPSVRRGLQPQRQLAALDLPAGRGSLRRLQTDWIDLYQLHRPDPSCDISESVGALERSRPRGQDPLLRNVHLPGARDRGGPLGGRAPGARAPGLRAGAVLAARARRSRPTSCL